MLMLNLIYNQLQNNMNNDSLDFSSDNLGAIIYEYQTHKSIIY